jgi:phosphoribosylcarboxyaminoimidazole (NCAIR) mutase
LEKFALEACQDGAKVFIGIAGMAAALAGCTGMVKPIISFPLDEHGIDSCAYMPPGAPVLMAGVGSSGLKNAAIAACQLLAISDPEVALLLRAYVADTNKRPQFDVNTKEKAHG